MMEECRYQLTGSTDYSRAQYRWFATHRDFFTKSEISLILTHQRDRSIDFRKLIGRDESFGEEEVFLNLDLEQVGSVLAYLGEVIGLNVDYKLIGSSHLSLFCVPLTYVPRGHGRTKLWHAKNLETAFPKEAAHLEGVTQRPSALLLHFLDSEFRDSRYTTVIIE